MKVLISKQLEAYLVMMNSRKTTGYFLISISPILQLEPNIKCAFLKVVISHKNQISENRIRSRILPSCCFHINAV